MLGNVACSRCRERLRAERRILKWYRCSISSESMAGGLLWQQTVVNTYWRYVYYKNFFSQTDQWWVFSCGFRGTKCHRYLLYGPIELKLQHGFKRANCFPNLDFCMCAMLFEYWRENSNFTFSTDVKVHLFDWQPHDAMWSTNRNSDTESKLRESKIGSSCKFESNLICQFLIDELQN